MNEQLQKLYRQAIESTNSDEYLDMPNKQIQSLTEYAQLIIRECCDFLKDTLDDQFAAEQLAEHFEFDN